MTQVTIQVYNNDVLVYTNTLSKDLTENFLDKLGITHIDFENIEKNEVFQEFLWSNVCEEFHEEDGLEWTANDGTLYLEVWVDDIPQLNKLINHFEEWVGV